jgi:glycosyltransferase involved in cell wall biosynthesis
MDVSETSLIYRAARIYFYLRNIILKRADAFIAISNPLIEEMTRIGIEPSRIIRVPNGIDIKRFNPAEAAEKARLRELKGISTSSVVFAYCGRLSKEKGLHLLLRVWEKLCGRYDDIHLLLVGTGEGLTLGCEGELREFVRKKNLRNSVTFTGAVDDVAEFLQCSDVFVMPSWSETQSLALVEAQACGLPAIATRVGGLPEVIEHNRSGFLVTLGDEEEMLEAAERLIIDEDLRRRLGSTGRQVALDRFSISKIAQKYLNVLQSVVPNSSAGR